MEILKKEVFGPFAVGKENGKVIFISLPGSAGQRVCLFFIHIEK
jgi:hypothetical protein